MGHTLPHGAIIKTWYSIKRTSSTNQIQSRRLIGKIQEQNQRLIFLKGSPGESRSVTKNTIHHDRKSHVNVIHTKKQSQISP